MTDTKTTLTWLLKDEVTGTAKRVNASLGNLEKKAGTSGGALGKLGTNLRGLVSPWALAAGGATLLAGALVDSVKAAVDEQKNIAKLGSALKANVYGWNGNTSAIEDAIKARENLAFSDDDLRDSLATLVGSTKDVKQAMDLQSLAMDLARFKGIDLATASDALAKANAGSTKELKALGITVDDVKDKTKVFAAIQQTVKGQADAYAKTTAGQWETLQIKLQDTSEAVGGLLLPVLTDLLTFVNNDLVPGLTVLGDGLGGIIDQAKQALQLVGLLEKQPKKVLHNLKDVAPGLGIGGKQAGLYAEGGTTRPGMAWVGEHGPELVRFSGGQQVIPAPQSAAMASGSSGQGFTIQGVSERDLLDMVERGLYFRLQTAGTAWRGS